MIERNLKTSINRFLRFLTGKPFLPVNTYVFDSHGKKLFKVYEQNREPLKIKDMPRLLLDAVVVMEDKRFYSHVGVDFVAITRALIANVKAFKILQGGSTITQQLVRNVFLHPKKRLSRKAIEGCMALVYEFLHTKKQILEDYLNTVYLGEGMYGLKNAAKMYFGKKVKHLAANEIAVLVGMIRSPGRYSPTMNPKSCDERRRFVLWRLKEKGLLSNDDYEHIRQQPVSVIHRDEPHHKALYARDFVKDILQHQFCDYYPHRKLIVQTSIDSGVQSCIEETLSEFSPDLNDGVSFCVLEPKTGLVKGITGGLDYKQTQFNAATHGLLQPGSTLKPFILAQALRSGYSPDSPFESKELEVSVGKGKTWKVHNWQDHYFGKTTLQEALINSDNSVFAQLIQGLDLNQLKELLSSVGIPVKRPTLSLATGGMSGGVSPLMLTASYMPFFNEGLYSPPRIITKVFTENKEIIYELKRAPIRVLDEKTALTVHRILKEVMNRGTGYHPALASFAGKTGTTERGSFLCLYDDEHLASVWVGFNPRKYRTAAEYYGKGTTPKTIFARFLSKLSPRKIFKQADITVF